MGSYRITGLAPDRFSHLFGLSDAALAACNAVRVTADCCPGFPDRIEMRDAAPGEVLLLVNYEHLAEASPYRAAHAIYVKEFATRRYDSVDRVPEVLRRRLISLRGYDRAHMMRRADVLEGAGLDAAIRLFFGDAEVAYLHAHNAKPGCFACRIDRVL